MEIKSRVPGMVVSVDVKVGDAVEARAKLGVLEAMKMEQPILSPVAGTVAKVEIAAGDRVKAGQVMIVVE